MKKQLASISPQAIDLEEVILGAMMLETGQPTVIIPLLSPEAFYGAGNGEIYKAICEMYESGEPVDILTVTHHLRRSGKLTAVGGPLYIAKLTNRVASTANIETHARIVQQKYVLREIIKSSNDAQQMAINEVSPAEIYRYFEGTISKLLSESDSEIKNVSAVIQELNHDIGERLEGKQNTVSTGFHELDKLVYGWGKSDLIYLAARPGMGKTSFVLSSAVRMARAKKPVLIFSLEMSAKQLVSRIIASEIDLEYKYIAFGKMDDTRLEHYHRNLGKVEGLDIYIDDTPALSVYEFRNRCRRMKEKYGIEIVFVDYVQLMTLGNKPIGNREQEISKISSVLKMTAKEIDIPVMALAQLSRKVEERKIPRPILIDLRESGSLEQDADIVAFIFRPEEYDITEEKISDSNVITHEAGKAEIIVAKFRNGSTGTVNLRFISRLSKFDDWNSHQLTIDAPDPDKFIESDTPF